MTKFTIDITDLSQLAGIADARATWNSSLSLSEGQAVEDHPSYIADDETYFALRMIDVAKSYALQFGYSTEELAAKQAEVAAMEAKQAEKGI